MAENPHFKELLLSLKKSEVRYLIVGGYAVMKYTEPHYTKDLDIWVEPSHENSVRLFRALKEFGAPLDSDGIQEDSFSSGPVVYQLGLAPVRIDILTQITGVDFPSAWGNRLDASIFGVPTQFISLKQLILNKEATGRSSDLEQLRHLSKAPQPPDK